MTNYIHATTLDQKWDKLELIVEDVVCNTSDNSTRIKKKKCDMKKCYIWEEMLNMIVKFCDYCF